MSTDTPIQAGAELDLAVAEAVGIRVCRDHGIWRRLDGSGKGRFFSPSTDWTAAMEAAEKVGLFKVHYDAGGRPWRWRLIQGIEMGKWLLNPMYVDECKEVEGVKDPRHFEEQPGPLAICAAILKLKDPT